MAEKAIVALVFLVTALPLMFIALRIRAGRNLEAVSGYHPERARDRAGFGRFVGNHLLAIALLVLVLAMAPTPVLTDERAGLWATLGFTALTMAVATRLVLGVSKFHRK